MTSQGSMAQPTPERPTEVVTCFLLRRDRGHDEVLLAQRSDRVRTYRGRWGAISGYLESGTSAHDQAYQEIREETSLGAEDVTLLREGERLTFRDETIATNWIVHPFLFLVLRPDSVVHDWEAHTFAWRTPESLRELETVPRLADALDLVYPHPMENV